MSTKSSKPKYTSGILIQKMRDDKGIIFNITKEKEAEEYLLNVNNYLRTAAYRKNYQKNTKGANSGKYINLEFAYLQELSTIDMHLRNIISQMSRDIEHSLKVYLLRLIESDSKDDGYDVINDFCKLNPKIIQDIGAMSCSPFTGDLISNYFTVNKVPVGSGKIINKIIDFSYCPAWVFFELLTFGDLIRFYTFYNKRNGKTPIVPKSILNLAKSLRNAASHNNCLIANLEHNTSNPPPEISKRIAKIGDVNTAQRQKKLSTRPMLEFVSLLFAYDAIVSSTVKMHGIEDLKNLFFDRMKRKREFFKTNELIKTNYEFACKVIDDFF